jgi:pimeloyl-ACP methyl ester carboxylesterase
MESEEANYVISLDKTKIWAEETGDRSRPTIIFLHGLGFSSVVFEKQFSDPFLITNLHMVR